MAYSFEQVFAADPANPSNIARNAAITIYQPGDPTKTPLVITDPSGGALSNPIPVNANGFGSAFMHATLDRVAWDGGGFTGFFTSYEGMKNEAVAAREAAQTAATTAGTEAAAVATAAIDTATDEATTAAAAATTAAMNAATAATAAANSAALVGAPADTAIAAAISGSGATKAALNSAYASKKDVRSQAIVPLRWFRNQVGGLATAPVDILFVSDSTCEGARALTRATRWIEQVCTKLRAKYQPAGVAGGLGYTPAIYTGGIPFGAASWTYLNALGPSTIYSDTFSRSGELNGSTPQTGSTWQATAGVYTLDGASAVTQTATGTLAYAPVGTNADREVTLNGTFGTLTTTNQYFQLLAMYDSTAPSNKVWLEGLVSQTTSTWRIVKRIGGTQTTMATYSTPPITVDPSNKTFTAKFKVDGLTLTATVDGNVLTATLLQAEKDGLSGAVFTGFQMPAVGSKVNDYSVATLGAAEVTVTPVLDGGYGLGLRAVKLGPTGSAGVMRRTFTGTAVDVIVTKRSGGGTIAVKIDGTVKTAIDTNNATEVNGFATRYGSLTQGSHTLELVCSSGYAILEGIMEYNQDETSGIRVWDGAHAGYNTASFTSITKWANSAKALMVPDLAFIALGLNDYAAQATIPPATYKANLLTIIGKVREANANVSIVMHNSWERGDVTSPTYPWSEYLAAVDEIVAADPSILLVDTSARLLGWNLVDPAYRNVWDADTIHLSPAGYGAVSNAIAGAISD